MLIIPSDGTNQTQIKNTYFTTSESLAPIGAISTPFCATRKGKNTTCGNNIYVLCSNFLVATNFGKQWNQSSKRIRDYKDEINSMEQLELECPNGRRQTLELHRKERQISALQATKTRIPNISDRWKCNGLLIAQKKIYLYTLRRLDVCLYEHKKKR